MTNKRSLYKIYKNFIKDKESELENKFRLRIDNTNFLYTIVNIDQETANKFYGENDRISKPIINEYIKTIDTYFKEFNMQEFVALRSISRIDDYNWKVEFSFSLFNTKKRSNIKIGIISTAIIATILSYFLIF